IPKKLKMALAIAAPTMPSTIFITNPISLFMNCSASQPAIPPMIMAAIQPIAGSPMARLLRRGVQPGTLLEILRRIRAVNKRSVTIFPRDLGSDLVRNRNTDLNEYMPGLSEARLDCSSSQVLQSYVSSRRPVAKSALAAERSRRWPQAAFNVSTYFSVFDG